MTKDKKIEEKKEKEPEQDRWYLGNGVSRIVDSDTSFLQILVGGFPESQWEEWNKDCKENFSNCRWAKILDNHEKAKDYERLRQVVDLLLADKFSVKEKKEEPPKEEFCLGGEKIEN